MEGLASALPLLLLVLACPIGMFFMFRMMGMGGRRPTSSPRTGAGGAPSPLEARERLALLQLRQDELSRQIAAARRELEEPTPAPPRQ